jgi:hypothetical protein
MTPISDPSNQAQSRQIRARRLRIAAVFVLLLGIIGAETLYWVETRSAVVADDAAMLGNEKAESRQLEVLYGNSNAALQEWVDELKHRPDEQAGIVLGSAALLTVGCLYFAWLIDQNHRES